MFGLVHLALHGAKRVVQAAKKLTGIASSTREDAH